MDEMKEYETVGNKSHFGPIYWIKYCESGILNQPKRARYRGKRRINAGNGKAAQHEKA